MFIQENIKYILSIRAVLVTKENRNKTIEFIEKHGVKNFANSFIGTLFYEQNPLFCLKISQYVLDY